MHLLPALSLTLASTTFAHVIREPAKADASVKDWCGTKPTDEWLAADFALPDPTLKRQAANLTNIVVDAWFHVVANSTRLEDGWVSNATLAKQFQILNEDYAPSGIQFKLKGVTRTVSPKWATGRNESDQRAMKRALRRGDYKTVNIYYSTLVYYPDTDEILNGLCTYPTKITSVNSTRFIDDGCQVWHTTLPGGPREAKTTTHEVGHWLGLHHTFQGGCEGTGDGVDDTPAEATASRGCDVTRDTCPNQPGYDPVHNFMDYSPPPCRSEFTPGQTTRMHNEWFNYRL